ncbi:Flp family type IVb pilin [Clostridiaceae bacterium HSG29]|nr:Flp family type IVb pilin [Clostridiaceae bacterium HSG29]
MLNYFKTYLSYYLGNEEGQGMVEYVLIIGLVAIAIIALVALFGTRLGEKFTEIKDAL